MTFLESIKELRLQSHQVKQIDAFGEKQDQVLAYQRQITLDTMLSRCGYFLFFFFNKLLEDKGELAQECQTIKDLSYRILHTLLQA